MKRTLIILWGDIYMQCLFTYHTICMNSTNNIVPVGEVSFTP